MKQVVLEYVLGFTSEIKILVFRCLRGPMSQVPLHSVAVQSV